MSTRAGAGAEPALLRWREGSEATLREELVELLPTHEPEIVIRSALKIPEKVLVYITTRRRVVAGCVISSRADGEKFLMRVAQQQHNPIPSRVYAPDPGVFAVEDFLSEEQEEAVLAELFSSGDRGRIELDPRARTSTFGRSEGR